MPEAETAGAEATPSGPEADDIVLGGDGDGADASGQDDTTDAESASKTDPDTTDADSDDALTEALISGKADALDADGEAKKAKPDAKAETPEKAEDPKAEKPEDKADEDPEEKALLDKARTKGERKELDKLFKERRELRPAKAFADALIKHATDAGLVSQDDKGLNTRGLHELIEQERFLKTRSKDQQAAYFRSLADSIAPIPKAVEPPKPVEIPQEVQDAVDAGYLSKEEAQVIAEKRAPKPEPKKEEPKQQEPPPVKTPTGPAPEATQKGYADIAEVSKGYQSQHKADWERIGAAVEKRIAPLIAKSPPEMWKDLAEMAMKAVIADLKPATKTPTPTTRPSQPPPKKGGILTEEDEMDALAKGRSF